MRLKIVFITGIIIIVTFLVAGCGAQATPVYAQGTVKDQVVAATAPITQDILNGIQQDNYALYTKDFDAAMLKASTQTSFETMIKSFAPYGEFKSSDLINVEIVDPYYRVNYKLTFANRVLTMGVVVPQSGTAAVSGLWFK